MKKIVLITLFLSNALVMSDRVNAAAMGPLDLSSLDDLESPIIITPAVQHYLETAGLTKEYAHKLKIPLNKSGTPTENRQDKETFFKAFRAPIPSMQKMLSFNFQLGEVEERFGLGLQAWKEAKAYHKRILEDLALNESLAETRLSPDDNNDGQSDIQDLATKSSHEDAEQQSKKSSVLELAQDDSYQESDLNKALRKALLFGGNEKILLQELREDYDVTKISRDNLYALFTVMYRDFTESLPKLTQTTKEISAVSPLQAELERRAEPYIQRSDLSVQLNQSEHVFLDGGDYAQAFSKATEEDDMDTLVKIMCSDNFDIQKISQSSLKGARDLFVEKMSDDEVTIHPVRARMSAFITQELARRSNRIVDATRPISIKKFSTAIKEENLTSLIKQCNVDSNIIRYVPIQDLERAAHLLNGQLVMSHGKNAKYMDLASRIQMELRRRRSDDAADNTTSQAAANDGRSDTQDLATKSSTAFAQALAAQDFDLLMKATNMEGFDIKNMESNDIAQAFQIATAALKPTSKRPYPALEMAPLMQLLSGEAQRRQALKIREHSKERKHDEAEDLALNESLANDPVHEFLQATATKNVEGLIKATHTQGFNIKKIKEAETLVSALSIMQDAFASMDELSVTQEFADTNTLLINATMSRINKMPDNQKRQHLELSVVQKCEWVKEQQNKRKRQEKLKNLARVHHSRSKKTNDNSASTAKPNDGKALEQDMESFSIALKTQNHDELVAILMSDNFDITQLSSEDLGNVNSFIINNVSDLSVVRIISEKLANEFTRRAELYKKQLNELDDSEAKNTTNIQQKVSRAMEHDDATIVQVYIDEGFITADSIYKSNLTYYQYASKYGKKKIAKLLTAERQKLKKQNLQLTQATAEPVEPAIAAPADTPEQKSKREEADKEFARQINLLKTDHKKLTPADLDNLKHKFGSISRRDKDLLHQYFSTQFPAQNQEVSHKKHTPTATPQAQQRKQHPHASAAGKQKNQKNKQPRAAAKPHNEQNLQRGPQLPANRIALIKGDPLKPRVTGESHAEDHATQEAKEKTPAPDASTTHLVAQKAPQAPRLEPVDEPVEYSVSQQLPSGFVFLAQKEFQGHWAKVSKTHKRKFVGGHHVGIQKKNDLSAQRLVFDEMPNGCYRRIFPDGTEKTMLPADLTSNEAVTIINQACESQWYDITEPTDADPRCTFKVKVDLPRRDLRYPELSQMELFGVLEGYTLVSIYPIVPKK